MALENSTSYRSHILIGQFKGKQQESCQKDVTKLSQTNQKLCTVATIGCAALLSVSENEIHFVQISSCFTQT